MPIQNSNQRNDPSFVFEALLDGDGGVTIADSESEAPAWLHFDYSTGHAEKSIVDLGIDASIAESLVRNETRPRTLATADGILVLLRGVNSNPGADPEDMVSLRMWIEPNRLITVRQRRLFSIQDVHGLLESGKGPVDIPSLVVAIIERIADRISEFLDTIEDRATQFEEAVETAAPHDIRREVTALRRQTAIVRRFLAPQRDALDNLFRHARETFDEDLIYSIREQSDRITRYVEDLDLVRERALVIQEELLNRIAQEQNARMYVLSVVAAIFLPITFITGLFGMNVAGLPGTENENAFWVVAVIMLIISLVVVALFRWRRWF